MASYSAYSARLPGTEISIDGFEACYRQQELFLMVDASVDGAERGPGLPSMKSLFRSTQGLPTNSAFWM
jgi:hypothetical protein